MPDGNQSFDAEGRQFAWDATSLDLASACLRKYYYIMREGWRARGLNPHLFFGGVYASAVEQYHKLRADGADHEEALRTVVRTALCATWIDGTPWESEHNTKTRPNLIRTIVWYLDEFADDSCKTIILADGKPAVELSFAIPLDGDIVLSGHLDRLVDYSGERYVADNKTTGHTITKQYFEHFSPDNQMSLYTFAGKAMFNLPIKGVIIDAAQIAVGFTRFERGFIFRDDASLQEWFDETMHLIERVRRASLDNYFPKNPSACFNFGGCQFRHVCSRSPEVRKQFLKADFTQERTWDPLEKR